MSARHRDAKTGRFIPAAAGRVRNVSDLGDDQAQAIVDAAVARANAILDAEGHQPIHPAAWRHTTGEHP